MEKMVAVERATQDELRQDLKSLFQGAIRVTLEMVLEEELKAMVGARRFERVGSATAQDDGGEAIQAGRERYGADLEVALGGREAVPKARRSSPPQGRV